MTARVAPGVEVTGVLQRETWKSGSFPEVERLGGGIWSIPVPIPGSPLRYVLSYAIATSAGPVIVDPGWPGDPGWDALGRGLATAGWDITEVSAVLATHCHTDHQGLATRVREVSGCWVGMHEADARILAGYVDGSLVDSCNHAWLAACGVPDAERAQGIEMDRELMRSVSLLVPDRLIADGDSGFLADRAVRAIWTPGHTPGHLCFALPEDRLLLAGDHVLPRISSHVGGYSTDPTDSLGDYLRALSLLPGEVGEVEVLPGHEFRFRGLGPRVRAAIAHHGRRLSQVHAVLSGLGRATAWEVAAGVEWSRGWEATRGGLRRLALAETVAHLRWLAIRQYVSETPGRATIWSAREDVDILTRITEHLERDHATAIG